MSSSDIEIIFPDSERAASELEENDPGPELQVNCGDKTFLVDSHVISQKSEFFKTMLQSAFKEANTHTVDLHDDEPEDIARMIDFVNTTDYRVDGLGKTTAFTNIRMYALGEKYIMPTLKSIALSKFKKVPEALWVPKAYIDVVRLTYNSTSSRKDPLRQLVTSAWKYYVSRAMQSISKSEAFEKLEEELRELPEAHVDFLHDQLRASQSKMKRLKADHNQQIYTLMAEMQSLREDMKEQLSEATSELEVELEDLRDEVEELRGRVSPRWDTSSDEDAPV